MKNKVLKFRKVVFPISLILFVLLSCKKQLNQTPKYGLNSETVYSDPDNYIQVLAKIYGGLAITGQSGPAGSNDLSGIDEGFSSYLRILWNLQVLPTDEAVCGWTDPGMPDMSKMTWSPENLWIKGMYYRIYFQITLCNEFLYQASEEKIEERGFSEADKNRIAIYREEVRFLRALSYYHAMDLYGSVPFIDEENGVGSKLPEQISRADLFTYIESELKDVEGKILASPEYGHANTAAVRTLLAKLYLNAEVYTGSSRYSDCITYCDKVINSSSFSLSTNHQDNFLADNHTSPEIIFPVVYSGVKTQTWGGTTFLVNAAIGGTMLKANYGVNGSIWAGLRVTQNFSGLFTDSMLDSRYLFYRGGQTEVITSLSNFTHGYAYPKFVNLNKDGSKASNNGNSQHVDIDFPLFRLADVYLMYAEANLRGGGGSAGVAVNLVNALRERAYGNNLFNYSTINLQDILDERAKELAWEGTRRTDLIRYNLYTSSTYVWPFKGGTPEGSGVSDHLKLYPLPTSDLVLNPNLTQNPGY